MPLIGTGKSLTAAAIAENFKNNYRIIVLVKNKLLELNFKNELFTGNLKTTWNKKEEVRPFFTPVADLSYIYGTPVRPEGEERPAGSAGRTAAEEAGDRRRRGEGRCRARAQRGQRPPRQLLLSIY